MFYYKMQWICISSFTTPYHQSHIPSFQSLSTKCRSESKSIVICRHCKQQLKKGNNDKMHSVCTWLKYAQRMKAGYKYEVHWTRRHQSSFIRVSFTIVDRTKYAIPNRWKRERVSIMWNKWQQNSEKWAMNNGKRWNMLKKLKKIETS